MIIDDQAFILDIMQSILSSSYSIESDKAESGKLGLEKVKERLESDDEMYRLIIIDYCMDPGWNGPETTVQIKKLLS